MPWSPPPSSPPCRAPLQPTGDDALGVAARGGGERGEQACDSDGSGQVPPGAAGAEEGGGESEDDLVLLPGLDGSIFVLGEHEAPTRLTEHTVQDLVAAPSIFGDDGGVLVGSKAVKL